MSGKFFHCLCFLMALPRASPSHLPCDLALSPARSLLHRTVWALHLQLPLLPNNDQNDRVCPPPRPLLPAAQIAGPLASSSLVRLTCRIVI